VVAVRGEEDAGGEGDVSGPSGTLAGYNPASDVEQHARIDMDIRDIEAAHASDPPDYVTSKGIYTNGKNSDSNGEFRTIQGFSKDYATNTDYQTEPFAILANNFWGAWDYGDQHLIAAFDGTDNSYGNYATGALGSDDGARKQIIKKVIKFQVVMQFALHELEAGLKKYNDESLPTASRYGIGGAVHALDEWWAFYAGSLEAGTANGFGPYILAEKRSKNFGTNTCNVGNGGVSCVNKHLIDRTNNLKVLMQSEGNSAEILKDVKCMRALLKVGPIQGCLEYAYKSSVASAGDLPVQKAEGWAFCGAALPFLHEVDQTAAASVKAEMTFTNDNAPTWATVRDAFSPANLNKMGVTCADIGSYATTNAGSQHTVCTDTSDGPSNAHGSVSDCSSTDVDASGDGSSLHSGLSAVAFASVLAAALAAM